MSIFKRKEPKKDLSSLPEMLSMPTFPEIPREKEAPILKPLPTMPFSFTPIIPKALPQQMEQIKVPVRPAVQEITEEELRMPEPPSMQRMEMPMARSREEPIFVKIDKYREALMNLETIKRKLHDTSNLLEKIKETRAKEEEELNIWAEEINAIKEKISVIDKKLFSA